MTEVDYDICQNQGRLYSFVAKEGFCMEWFSEAYLKSSFCKRAFDTIYSRFQLADELECLDFILPEIGTIKMLPKEERFSPDVASWIGFTYRQLYMETQILSEILADKVDFATMCRYYPGLHTIEEDMAIDIICKDKGLKRISLQ